jgi:hypothetical protein
MPPATQSAVSYNGDMFYDINLDGFYADVNGNLDIYFYASGAGWQGGTDESFAIDNVQVSSTIGCNLTPGAGTPPNPAPCSPSPPASPHSCSHSDAVAPPCSRCSLGQAATSRPVLLA